MNRLPHLLTATTVLCLTPLALADYTQNGVVIANEFGNHSVNYNIGNIFDQSGLSANYISGVTDFDTFASQTTVTTDGNQHDSWFGTSFPVLPKSLTFDLGSELAVTQLALWSYTNRDNNAWDDFTIFIDDNPAFSSPVNAGSFTFINGNSTGDVPRPSQVFDVTDTTGRYVQIQLTSRNTEYVGMGEVVFAIVPEPTSLALLGLGGMLVARRRR